MAPPTLTNSEKIQKPHHQTEKSWKPYSGTGKGHFSIFCLEETPSMLLFSKLKDSLTGKTFFGR
jgi:hypothetical protein